MAISTISKSIISCATLLNANLNNIDYNFFGYVAGGSTTNVPVTGQVGFLQNMVRSDAKNYRKQYFFPFNSDAIYERRCVNGTWSAWFNVTIFTGEVLDLGSTYPTYPALIASASSIEFFIPINRYMISTTATFNNLYLRVWDDNGTQVVNAVDVANTTGYTLNIQVEQNSGLRVKVTNSSINFGTAYHMALVNLRNGTKVTFG